MIKPGMFISDRYEIIDKVGSGGMADVYKALCHRLNRYVAIKILKPEYSTDKSFVTKFRGEAQSAAGLSHPNIVSVYDVGDDEGLHYIVMELVEGITLKRFIERKGRLDIKEAIGIAIQIAQGMEAAHDNHIIHRDIKPQNIIISKEGKVKVADFGIAKAPTSNTTTQNAVGSVHYLSPEQARGGYSDERSDIYSLGVTIYEMLCGQVPFAGDNSVSVALLHIQSEATPIREINPDVPRSADRIVQKCMQKKPERRYLSASELIHDLKRSIINPDGDFVNLTMAGTVVDSPTIHMSDEEMSHIKSAAKSPAVHYDNGKDPLPKKIKKEEEEELDSIDSRLERVLAVLGIVAAVALGLFIMFLLAKFFGVFGGDDAETQTTTPYVSASSDPTTSEEMTSSTEESSSEEESTTLVVMVNVVGLTSKQATDTLNAISPDFQIKYKEGAFSDEFKAGEVMEQYPPKDTGIDSKSEIILTLSAGTELLTVPELSGESYEQAKKKLDGFQVIPEYTHHDTIAKDFVIRTDRVNGEKLPKGTPIIVYVSLGQETKTAAVPNLMGKSEKKANQALEAAGFVKGKVSRIYSEEYEEGQVCYQNYTNGTKLPVGSAVDYSVSKGFEPTTTEPTTAEPTTAEPTTAEPTEPLTEPSITEPPTEPATETGGDVSTTDPEEGNDIEP